jgi:LPXTG-motif cell wall-anchored protein
LTVHTCARLRARALRGTAGLAAAIVLAAALTGALAAGPAAADPDPAPADTTETSTTTEVTEPPAPPTENPVEPTEPADPTAPTETTPPADEPAEDPGTPEDPSPVEPREPRDLEPTPPTMPGAEQPQIEVTAEFDKSSYRTGDPIDVTVKVRNAGTAGVEHVEVFDQYDPDNLFHDPAQWGDFRSYPGVTLAPGETREVHLSGRANRPQSEKVVLKVRVYPGFQATPIEASFSAPIVLRTGRVTGVVYKDLDHDHVIDPGEALAGHTVVLSYGFNWDEIRATAGSDGRFDFGKVLTWEYFLNPTETDGWTIPSQRFTVDEDGVDLVLRLAKPYDGTLQVTMAFTKDTYAPGETAHITVTLTNSGSKPFQGLVARCNGIGNDDSLTEHLPGWGDLVNGLTLAPGETRVIDVTDTVPQAAYETGQVHASCIFGHEDDDLYAQVWAGDDAAVPGAVATLEGTVERFENGGSESQGGVAGVRLVLVNNELPCPLFVETTTDANGHYAFTNLTPGRGYQLYVVPPEGLRFINENPLPVQVRAWSKPMPMLLIVVPGTAEQPEIPAQPASCPNQPAPVATPAPAPQARADGALAETGASVIGLGAFGLLTVLGGAAALVVTRRRRSAA